MSSRRAFLAAALAGVPIARQHLAAFAQGGPFTGTRAGDRRIVDGMALRWCPAGSFVMGSPVSEPDRRADEAQVTVTFSRGFWMAESEATQGQWQRVVGAFPDALPTADVGIGDDMPLYWVNYLEAETFCRRLTERARAAGTLPAGWMFALPTEAQWEYACRAGTTTGTSFGDRLGRDQANFKGPVWNGGRDLPALGHASVVNSYPPNAWGLYDMHGNIFEWVRDWYHARLPGGVDPDLSMTRGVPNRDGTYSRVRRGGAWIEDGWTCRSAFRLRYEPERRSDHIGFRVAVVPAAG